MTRHVLERRQIVPADLHTVFSFFEDPWNLERLTPPWLNFNVRATTDRKVRLGTEIEYRLRWQIFPMTWRSRISEYVPGVRFADEMLEGPYKRWYHRHLFNEVTAGVEIVDIVEYELPLGPLGRIVHAAVIRSQLESIFDYRRRAATRLFEEARLVIGR
ncbi:MAG: SRPBCC family protein [Gemmatimonadetes bacterium]|nr:SRPBCC family protein [Gemmatimonadota bacterium]